jgi:hypothetical protein
MAGLHQKLVLAVTEGPARECSLLSLCAQIRILLAPLNTALPSNIAGF